MSRDRRAPARTPHLDHPDEVPERDRVAVIADMLGTPLMPWQRQVADVALERDPDDPTRWRYPTVIVTVPRESGNTRLMRALAAVRTTTKETPA